MKKSPKKILAEMEYVQETIDVKLLEMINLQAKKRKLQQELAETLTSKSNSEDKEDL